MVTKYIRKEVNKTGRYLNNKQAQWSEKQKFQAVVTFLAGGTTKGTSAATGIPLSTIKFWRKQPWWDEMVQEIKQGRTYKQQASLEKITEKVLDQLEDRLDRGDIGYNPKTKEIYRIGINARTLNMIAKDSIDRQILLDNFNKNIQAQTRNKENDIIKRLDVLKKEFEAFSRSKKGNTYESTAKEIKDIYDETSGHTEPLVADHSKSSIEPLEQIEGSFGEEGEGDGEEGVEQDALKQEL